MCENTIKKVLFDVTQNGQPKAMVWVDEDDITMMSDAKQINFKEQVAYLFFKSELDKIELKKNGDWWNIIVPAVFKESFEKNKGLQKAFNNAFKSIKTIRDGGQTLISEEEKLDMFKEFMENNISLYEVAFDMLAESKNKSIKAIMKNIEGKASDQVSAIALAKEFIGPFVFKFNQTYKTVKSVVEKIAKPKVKAESKEKTLEELLDEVEQVTVVKED